MNRFLMWALATTIAWPRLHAQGTPSSGAPASPVDTSRAAPRGGFCWRAKPMPKCRSYLVTEMSMEVPVGTTKGVDFDPIRDFAPFDPIRDFGTRVVWAGGLMVNRSASSAIGGTFAISTDGNVRLEARHRRWKQVPAGAHGADLSVGYAQKSVWLDPNTEVTARGVTAALGVSRGVFGVHTRTDLLYGGGKPRAAALVGFSLGSHAALLGTAALVGTFFAMMAGDHS